MIERLVVTLLAVLFLVVLFGGGALLRRRHIDMDGEPPIDRPLFVASKYAIVLVWGAMVAQAWGAPMAFVEVPPAARWAGLILWAAGFAVLFTGRFGLGSSFRIGSPRESTRLKVEGLFSLSRNPMYLGVYATLLASTLYTLNPIVLAVGAFIVAVHHRIVLAEERHLTSAFGTEYVDYCRRVRRYL
jgi:protein-S-isoprenylcysteine O-methyltransferase Ste14